MMEPIFLWIAGGTYPIGTNALLVRADQQEVAYPPAAATYSVTPPPFNFDIYADYAPSVWLYDDPPYNYTRYYIGMGPSWPPPASLGVTFQGKVSGNSGDLYGFQQLINACYADSFPGGTNYYSTDNQIG